MHGPFRTGRLMICSLLSIRLPVMGFIRLGLLLAASPVAGSSAVAPSDAGAARGVAAALESQTEAGPQRAADPQLDPLRQAVRNLDRWLGAGENAERWRRFLRLKQLDAELSRAAGEADPETLARIEARFETGYEGLERGPVIRVRQALGSWLRRGLPPAAELPEYVRRQAQTFEPLSDALLEASEKRLGTAARKLDRYLERLGENGRKWKRYLKWNEFQEQVARGRQADPAGLAVTYRALAADHSGLELEPFQEAADALELHIDRVAAAAVPDAGEKYRAEMEKLGQLLQDSAGAPNDDVSLDIAERLVWLEAIGAAPRSVRGVRVHYGQPNAFASASTRLISEGLARPVERIDPLVDTILGTRIRGTTHTSAQVRAHLIPSRQGARIATGLAGTAHGQSVGRNGPATIHSESWTRITAEKRLVFDEHGIHVEPATSRASTRSVGRGIHVDVRFGKRLAQRIASRRVAEQRSLANRIASRHAEARINRSLDSESAERVATANERYLNRVRLPLVRHRQFPHQVHVSSSSDRLQIHLTQANRFQLAAFTAPPAESDSSDLSVRLHQSSVNNLAQGLLAGRTLTENDVQKKAIEVYGELPEKLRPDPEDEPWSISFAPRRPVTIEFSDGRLDMTVRGSRYTSGERQFSAMNVRAVYQLETSGGRARLVRQGDLEIFPPGFNPATDRLSASQVALRRLLSKRFGKLLEPTIESQGLELPGQWKKLGKLSLERLDSQLGWLALAWSIPPR